MAVDCPNPDELSAACEARTDLPAALAQHLAACATCAQRWTAAQQAAALVAAAVEQSACPDAEQLAAFVERTLAADAHNAVARHLVECESCWQDAADLREPSVVVPTPALRARLLQLAVSAAPAPRITTLPRWVPVAAAAGLAAMATLVALGTRGGWSTDGADPTTHTVAAQPFPTTGETPSTPAGAASGSGAPAPAAPATNHVPPVSPASTAAATSPAVPSAAPNTAAPAMPTPHSPMPPTPPTGPDAPATPTGATTESTSAPSTPWGPSGPSGPSGPAVTSPSAPATATDPTPSAGSASGPAPSVPATGPVPTPAPAPPAPAVVSLEHLSGKVSVQRVDAREAERVREAQVAVAPGDVIAPVNGKPVSFLIDDEVTVALRTGARARVSRQGDALCIDLERGACAIETLGLPRAITVRTPSGALAGRLVRAEVWANARDMQAGIAEGTATVATPEGDVAVAQGQGVVCAANGLARVRPVDVAVLARWAEPVLPACERCGRSGARCPVCLRAAQILSWRLQQLGGGAKGRRPGAPEEGGEEKKNEKKDEKAKDEKKKKDEPPSSAKPPGPGPGPGPGNPPGPGPGNPPPPPGAGPQPPVPPAGGPQQPAAPDEGTDKKDEPEDEGGTASPTPRAPEAPTSPPNAARDRHFRVPAHLMERELPACCRSGRSRCWLIIRKYGPALPWPWPATSGTGADPTPRKEH